MAGLFGNHQGTMAQQRGSGTLSLAVGEARKYLDTFMMGHGFRRIRKGVFEVDRSDDISLILEEAFTASSGDVHVNMLVYLDFLTVRPLLERLYGKKWIWPGLSQFHPETIFNNELKAYARYFENLDQTSIDRLLGKYVELARRIRAQNPDLASYVAGHSELLDKPYEFTQPFAVRILALIACEIELGHYERVRQAVHWIRTNNSGIALSGYAKAQLDRVDMVLAEREGRP
ncbi:hypothetical protein NKH69_15500 [Mesorhizobium sp. M0976]|uniref:hypothetical protein n=1 Tax=unclassified Mesorhizobium TaxID=325217 RepID=UPI00333B97D4